LDRNGGCKSCLQIDGLKNSELDRAIFGNQTRPSTIESIDSGDAKNGFVTSNPVMYSE